MLALTVGSGTGLGHALAWRLRLARICLRRIDAILETSGQARRGTHSATQSVTKLAQVVRTFT
jgi:hypothetical protein